MICLNCGTYLDSARHHIWRLELRDVPPGKDDAHLMLGAALCQACAMDIVKELKTCKSYPEAKENS